MPNEIQKWADVAMFKAEPIDVEAGPQVQLLSCNADPLGTIAAAALMYEGKSVQSLAAITDEQRRYYLDQTRKTALAAPLEFVNFHFLISGVTRGFTHQMVRQRTATYTQESTRFAVKESVPVGYPPSLADEMPLADRVAKLTFDNPYMTVSEAYQHALEKRTDMQFCRDIWDIHVKDTESVYNTLIDHGLPAEDARGLLPTNLLTRINYNTSLRGLLEHSGVRLCTQAQFEWRLVWTKIKEAIVEYGKTQVYFGGDDVEYADEYRMSSGQACDSTWQFEELATIFKPICYQKGSCQFNADVDRACKIKGRVEQFASLGIPSAKWGDPWAVNNKDHVIKPIEDEEWMLDSTAARVSQ